MRANAQTRYDPTKTTTIRNKFERDIVRRFKRLERLVTEEVAKLDGFGLRSNRGAFEFERSTDKVAAFMGWLREQEINNGLAIERGASLSTAADQSWANIYITTAYTRGLNRAASALRQGGARIDQRWVDAAFRRPIHADRLGLAYTRSFTQLNGITDTMDQQISRVLAEGLGDGSAPATIARNINNRISKIGITRARMLARTEVISAHAEATLNVFEEAGIEGVNVEPEWLLASDACPVCVDLEAKGPYTLKQARGMIPVHPNCRCAWSPKVIGGSGIELL